MRKRKVPELKGLVRRCSEKDDFELESSREITRFQTKELWYKIENFMYEEVMQPGGCVQAV